MRPSKSGSGSTVLAVVAVVLVGLGIYFNLPRGGGSGGESGAVSDEERRDGDAIRSARSKPETRIDRKLRISPDRIDLGTLSQCRPSEPYDIVLNNDGPEDVTVVGFASTCACVAPQLADRMVVPARGFVKLPLRVDPLGLGGKSHRIDFRLEGNARGGSVRVDYRVESAIIPMPVLVVRPDAADSKVFDLHRVDPEGKEVSEKFTVRSVEPPVARFVESAGDGHAAIEIDFKAIDRLAEDEAGRGSLFEWDRRSESPRWKSLEITVSTDCPSCESLRIRVRNRG